MNKIVRALSCFLGNILFVRMRENLIILVYTVGTCEVMFLKNVLSYVFTGSSLHGVYNRLFRYFFSFNS